MLMNDLRIRNTGVKATTTEKSKPSRNTLLLLIKLLFREYHLVLHFPTMETVKLDKAFFALSDHKRREILNLLSEGPLTVSQLAGELNISLTNISKNISQLEKADLLYKSKKGRQVYCHINRDTWLELASYINMPTSFWQNRLADLEHFISQQKHRPGTGPIHRQRKRGA